MGEIYKPLDYKTAIVTGGSRGIGEGICKRLAADGARVVVNYSNDASAVADITRSGGFAAAKLAKIEGQAYWTVSPFSRLIRQGYHNVVVALPLIPATATPFILEVWDGITYMPLA